MKYTCIFYENNQLRLVWYQTEITWKKWQLPHARSFYRKALGTRLAASLVFFEGSMESLVLSSYIKSEASVVRLTENATQVNICILAFLLVFHAISHKRSSFRENLTNVSTIIRR